MRQASMLVSAWCVAAACLADVPAASYAGSFSCFRNNLTGGKGLAAAVLVVHVVASDGEPMPGAAVSVMRAGDKKAVKKYADKAGRAVFNELRDGSYAVTSEMAAFYPGTVPSIRVEQGCTTGISFPLQVVDVSD